MDLVCIYGPPAAGKFTVASALAQRTGYRLFHNHVSISAVTPVLAFGTPVFWRVVDGFRESMIEAAAEEDISLIITHVYEHSVDDSLFERRFAVAEHHGGRVCLVQLACPSDELMRRVASESRARLDKLTDPDLLAADLAVRDLTSPIPGRESLTLHTAEISPEEAARRIIEHYALEDQRESRG